MGLEGSIVCLTGRVHSGYIPVRPLSFRSFFDVRAMTSSTSASHIRYRRRYSANVRMN